MRTAHHVGRGVPKRLGPDRRVPTAQPQHLGDPPDLPEDERPELLVLPRVDGPPLFGRLLGEVADGLVDELAHRADRLGREVDPVGRREGVQDVEYRVGAVGHAFLFG